MSDFRLFDTNKKAAFLNKAKEVKAKREIDAKKNQAILTLQKNIRAFLTFRMHDSPLYPMLMSTPGSIDNQQYFLHFWATVESQPQILKQRFIKQAIRAFVNKQQIHMNPNLETALVAHCQQSELKEVEYRAILTACQSWINGNVISNCLKYKNFREALRGVLGSIHDVTDLAVKVDNLQIASQILMVWFYSGGIEVAEGQNEERLLKSYYNAISLLSQAITLHADSNAIIQLVSILVQRLKRYYTTLVMHRYNIQRELFESVALRQEVEEMLKEKREWEEYQSHLYHICKLIPNIMESYISKENKSLGYALDLLVEVTKLGESVVSLNISIEDFFLLIERLNSKGTTDQPSRVYQFLIVILMIEKYLEGLNDLKFSQIFRYEADRLRDAICSSIIKFVKGLVNYSNENATVREIYRHSLAFLNNLYNKIFRTGLLKTNVFEDPSINIFQNNYKYSNYGNVNYMKELMKIVELCPFLLPINTRFLVFRKMIAQEHYYDHELGNRSVIINRGKEFEDAMAQLYHRNLKSRYHIRFINQYGNEEIGMDAGGLTKEFLTRLFKTAFNPRRGWFIENDRKELLPNPDYWRLQDGALARQYEFIGRLLGKSLRENIMLGVKFAGPFLNMLLNNHNCFDDLLLIDADLYRSLIYIVEMEEGVEELCLTFQYHDNLTKKTVNLKPSGERQRVTRHNKMEYVNLLINYKVNRSMERQTRFIRKGLRALINDNWIRMFNYAEFNYLLSGTGTIDVTDWIKYARVMGNDGLQIIDWFWNIVGEMEEEEKSLLLKFVTSCERPSFLGFKDLQPPFTIRITGKNDNSLPVSHTCSNVLDLPAYSSRKIMKEKLLYAIKSGAGFEMA